MIRKLRIGILTLYVLATSSAIAMPMLGGSVLYVDDDAAQGGDGTNWETAHRFLQEALADASEGGFSEIHVAQGVYNPDRNESSPDGSTDRDATFSLISGVALMGGYAGIGADNPDERDIEKYVTILSGDLLNNDEPEFQNMEDNSYHVLTSLTIGFGTSLDGLSIMGGNANGPDELDGGGGLKVYGGSLLVTHCTFRINRAFGGDVFHGGAGIYCTAASIIVLSSTFENNWAEAKGGAMKCDQAENVTISDCLFINNYSGVAAGVYVNGLSSLTVTGCDFKQNQTVAGAAGMYIHEVDAITIFGCTFTNNYGGFVGGGLVMASLESLASISNCYFANNYSTMVGGGAVVVGDVSFVNCCFSGNTSPWGGGLLCQDQTFLDSCTFGGNNDNAIRCERGFVELDNCIAWGNIPEQFIVGEYYAAFIAEYCNVQGGWSGIGNTDIDPLFVNPGDNNLRLSYNSPCIDAGNNYLVPDGLDYDLDGEPRFMDDPDVDDTGQGTPPIVDMGAYEGSHEPEDSQASESDLDQGEIAIIIPSGGGINFLENAMVIVTNTSGPDNATFAVTEIQLNPHPAASGFSNLGSTLRMVTSLEDGQFFAQVFIPFVLDQLNGLDPMLLDAINFHKGSGNWVLGTVGNTQDSPGRHGPIGDKVQMINDGSGFGVTGDLGDYGVLYDPILEQGFVWMNVDSAGDFGFGEQLCIADCQPFGGDNYVHVPDLLTMFSAWGLKGASGICDVDRNDIVNESDLLTLLDNWGLCEESAGATWPEDSEELATALTPRLSRNNRNADLDNNGIVDKADLLLLHAAWGSSVKGSRADLDADGKVGTADLIKLLANWGRTTKQ